MNKKHFFSDIQDVTDYLNNIPSFQTSGMAAANMGLGQISDFCRAIGNPQKKSRYIHVAGTNGKGSVTAMLASVYQQAGYKVGMYTSPHMEHFRERIRINGVEIDDQQTLTFFSRFEEQILAMPHTYFELLTVLGFWYFADQNVDIAIIETGLGGRYDATNIITPEVSVITTVSLDHTDYLGNNITAIAREKAGIIKPGKAVVTGNVSDDAMQVIRNTALELNAKLIPCTLISDKSATGFTCKSEMTGELNFQLPYAADVQKYNIGIVISVVTYLKNTYPLDWKHVEYGVNHAFELLPGRMENLLPGYRWYFDGAHNTQAIHALFNSIRASGEGQKTIVFLSVMKDKLNEKLTDEIYGVKAVYYHELKNTRAATYNSVHALLPACSKTPDELEQITSLLKSLKSELVIFTGSFYFYTTVRKWIESFSEIQ